MDMSIPEGLGDSSLHDEVFLTNTTSVVGVVRSYDGEGQVLCPAVEPHILLRGQLSYSVRGKGPR